MGDYRQMWSDLGMDLEKLGFIPLDAVVPKAVKEQQPFILGYPRSIVAQNISQIATKLVNGDTRVLSGSVPFFQRLLGIFKQVDQNEHISS